MAFAALAQFVVAAFLWLRISDAPPPGDRFLTWYLRSSGGALALVGTAVGVAAVTGHPEPRDANAGIGVAIVAATLATAGAITAGECWRQGTPLLPPQPPSQPLELPTAGVRWTAGTLALILWVLLGLAAGSQTSVDVSVPDAPVPGHVVYAHGDGSTFISCPFSAVDDPWCRQAVAARTPPTPIHWVVFLTVPALVYGLWRVIVRLGIGRWRIGPHRPPPPAPPNPPGPPTGTVGPPSWPATAATNLGLSSQPRPSTSRRRPPPDD